MLFTKDIYYMVLLKMSIIGEYEQIEDRFVVD